MGGSNLSNPINTGINTAATTVVRTPTVTATINFPELLQTILNQVYWRLLLHVEHLHIEWKHLFIHISYSCAVDGRSCCWLDPGKVERNWRFSSDKLNVKKIHSNVSKKLQNNFDSPFYLMMAEPFQG